MKLLPYILLYTITIMRSNSKDFLIFFEETREEIDRLIFAWKIYIKREIFYNVWVRRFFASVVIGLGVSLVIGSLLWWIKSSAYAQEEIVIDQTPSFFLSVIYFWVAGGGLMGVIIGFIRARYQEFKRYFDFMVAGLSLMILSPLFLIIAILIKIDSEGPVFFKQGRVGQKGKTFKMWKFRTMRNDAELETGSVWAQEGDPRVTGIGRFLRRPHLDELPQLINVFRGEMSLIGPRPERPVFVEEINGHIPDFNERLKVKPGITGLAQVRYRYGASIKDAGRKLKYDLLYIKRMCWMLDIRIMFWTVGRVLTGEGAR